MKINKRDIIIFLIMFAFTLIIFSGFITMHYATDTYNIFARGYVEYALTYSLNDGRPFMCLISLIANAFNMPITAYVITLSIISIFISCISVILLKNIILNFKRVKNKWPNILLLLICYVTIFNIMYLENLQFAECTVMAVSVLLYILAANTLIKKEKMYLTKSFILVAIGELFYQGTIGFFVTLVFLFSILKENNLKQCIKNIIISGIMCVLSVGINLIQIRITGHFLGIRQVRMGSIKNIFINIPYILNSMPEIVMFTVNMFPARLFFMYIVVILSMFIIYMVNKENNKDIIEKVFWLAWLILITVACSFAINIFSLAGFNGARMLFALGSLTGVIMIYLFVNTKIFEQSNIFKIIMSVIIISYFLIININYVVIINEHKKVNELTKNECLEIGKIIRNYEEKSENIVKNIAVYYDKKVKYYYDDFIYYNALTLRPLSVEWGDNGAISYYNNLNLKEVLPSKEVYENHFKEKDWDKLNEEQFVFIGDTMHYCAY